MPIKNFERTLDRLEKTLPPLPGELFPYIDSLIATAESGTMSLTGDRYGPHPTISLKNPNQSFTAVLQQGLPNQHSIDLFLDLLRDFCYDEACSPIRCAIDARWPRLRWGLVCYDPLFQAWGYHDTLDYMACDAWQRDTDIGTWYGSRYTTEQDQALYQQYRQLPSPEHRKYRQHGLSFAPLYCHPSPGPIKPFGYFLLEER